MKTLSTFYEQERMCKFNFPSHRTIFFPPEKYHPEESLRILIPEGQIKFLNPQKYIAN